MFAYTYRCFAVLVIVGILRCRCSSHSARGPAWASAAAVYPADSPACATARSRRFSTEYGGEPDGAHPNHRPLAGARTHFEPGCSRNASALKFPPRSAQYARVNLVCQPYARARRAPPADRAACAACWPPAQIPFF